ncbi:hypothetical protein M5689_025227 [Euphorbia peplus]|nr:hypothetical protein M5689_025227 [Euphorbia peplus]
MSERATLFLLSIGLLGEYCPTSRKKTRLSSDKLSCMHSGLFDFNSTDSIGCQFMQPLSSARNNLSAEGRFPFTRKLTPADLRAF